MATVHENYDYIPVRAGMILQLHRDLYRYSGMAVGGSFKIADNIIAEDLPDGTRRVRFQPVPAWETPETMDRLCESINQALSDPEMDPLLLIPMFILDFLCVHPFNDGNGRMSRLLTLLLLYRAGYIVGKYISVYQDCRRNEKWGFERATARCFASGSVLRLEAKDEPLDISEIIHCFIGERNGIGYGEIVTYPAKGQYYRLAEKTAPVRYAMPYQETGRSLKMGSNLTDAVITAMVRSRVRGLAIADRQEYAKGHSVQELIPTELLLMLRERYDPMLPENTMARWYEEALKEDEDDGSLY